MTRSEFEEISEFWELRDFANDNGLYNCIEDYLDCDDLDEFIKDDVADWDDSWESLGRALLDLPSGYDFYYREGYLYYYGYNNNDDAFFELKDRVLQEFLDNDEFDPEDEEDEEEDAETDSAEELEMVWFGAE